MRTHRGANFFSLRRATIWALALLGLVAATALGPAQADAAFGLTAHEVTLHDSGGDPITQAGSHPSSYTTRIELQTITDPVSGAPIPEEELKDLYVDLPAGLIGNPAAVDTCPMPVFLLGDNSAGDICPSDTVVGFAVTTTGPGNPPDVEGRRVYRLDPIPGVAARFGFKATGVVPVVIAATVSPDPPYHLIARVENVSQINPFLASTVTLWGDPSDPAHDVQRGGPPAPAQQPFLTMPRSCPGTPLEHRFLADSWVNPGTFLAYTDSDPAMEDCASLVFDPDAAAAPTTTRADSNSGFDYTIDVEDPGLSDPDQRAESDLKKAIVTLPEGMTVNPASAEGLEACSPAQVDRETYDSDFGAGCPAASKVGSVTIDTPLLPGEPVEGSIFLATPDDPSTAAPGAENPFDTLLAGYIVAKNRARGVSLVLPGRIDADPATGRLTASFDENPQFPFSHLAVHFKDGDRGVLSTPPTCGVNTVTSELFPWSGNPSLVDVDSFTVDRGASGGPCAAGDPARPADPADRGRLPFGPQLSAGTMSPTGGAFSSFVLRLTRQDGEQEITGLTADLPPGLLGKLAGIDSCSDAALASIQTLPGNGRGELSDPSCPAGSRVGYVRVGAGSGPHPFYIGGTAYLAGPYKGAPLSMAIVTPAVAGPFDLGTVVVRTALYIDREAAKIRAVSDPLPTILEGIALHLRDVRVVIDRPGFILNPTSCDPLQITAQASGAGAALTAAGDDSTASSSDRFQASDCGRLGFKPKLALKLKGSGKKKKGKKGSKFSFSGSMIRGGNPALSAVLRMNGGPEAGNQEANIEKISVRLPHSAFLDQAHIRTICTRVQFAAGDGNGSACPAGSVYGRARAITPLLGYPLEGNVYLRSSNNPLPDMVLALSGPSWQPIAISLVGRIDSRNGGIRTTFENVPDAPVSKVFLEMQGGRKGLITNSRNLCKSVNRAAIDATGQNADSFRSKVTVRPASCPKRKKGPAGPRR